MLSLNELLISEEIIKNEMSCDAKTINFNEYLFIQQGRESDKGSDKGGCCYTAVVALRCDSRHQ